MKKWLQKLRGILSSAFPSAASPYWRALPLRRMKSLLAGAFFITAVAGFAADLVQLNIHPLGRGFFWPAFFGAGAVVGSVAPRRQSRGLAAMTTPPVCGRCHDTLPDDAGAGVPRGRSPLVAGG